MLTLYVPQRHAINRMQRVMDELFNNDWETRFSNQSRGTLPLDVREEENEFIISSFIPAVSPEDLQIEILENTVSIRGEIKTELDEKANYLLRERPFGEVSRTIKLSSELDANKAEATLKDGVLTLRVPKSEVSIAKTIKVKTK